MMRLLFIIIMSLPLFGCQPGKIDKMINADKGSGYDRGHMCPAGDNKWGFKPMKESFLLTNICPQDHNLNCGDWNELEITCREWADKYGDINIISFQIYLTILKKWLSLKPIFQSGRFIR